MSGDSSAEDAENQAIAQQKALNEQTQQKLQTQQINQLFARQRASGGSSGLAPPSPTITSLGGGN